MAKKTLKKEQEEQTIQDVMDNNEKEIQKLDKSIEKSERIVKDYQTLMLRVVIVIALVWILLFKVVGITHAPTNDMSPRIDAGDLLLFYRLEKHPLIQDIVVVENREEDTIWLGRIIAGPGDKVEVTENQTVIVNGNTLIEPKIFYDTPIYEDYTKYPVDLGPNEYFALADMREGGVDSRYYGVVHSNDIAGTVITVVRRNNL